MAAKNKQYGDLSKLGGFRNLARVQYCKHMFCKQKNKITKWQHTNSFFIFKTLDGETTGEKARLPVGFELTIFNTGGAAG